MERDKIMNELELLNSSINRLDKRDFTAPEGYFPKMQDAVMQRLKEEKSKKNSSIWAYKRILSVAAALTIIFAAILVIRSNLNSKLSFNDLNQDMVYSYLTENLDDLHEYTLIEYFDEEITTDLSDLEDEELEEYLDDYLEEEDELYLEQLL